MESNQLFESKFRDASWRFNLAHQQKDSLGFVSTNLGTGLGLANKLFDSIFITIKMNTIIDSNFIDIYPSMSLYTEINDFKLALEARQKYRKQYFQLSTSYLLYNDIDLSVSFEDFKNHESRALMALEISL